MGVPQNRAWVAMAIKAPKSRKKTCRTATQSPIASAKVAKASQTGSRPIICQPGSAEVASKNMSRILRASKRLMLDEAMLITERAALGKAAFFNRLAFSR